MSFGEVSFQVDEGQWQLQKLSVGSMVRAEMNKRLRENQFHRGRWVFNGVTDLLVGKRSHQCASGSGLRNFQW